MKKIISKKYFKKIISYLIVIFCLILGFIGLALPLVPQAIFFAIAFIILSFDYPPLENFIEKHLKKDNKIGKTYFALKSKFEKYLK